MIAIGLKLSSVIAKFYSQPLFHPPAARAWRYCSLWRVHHPSRELQVSVATSARWCERIHLVSKSPHMRSRGAAQEAALAMRATKREAFAPGGWHHQQICPFVSGLLLVQESTESGNERREDAAPLRPATMRMREDLRGSRIEHRTSKSGGVWTRRMLPKQD